MLSEGLRHRIPQARRETSGQGMSTTLMQDFTGFHQLDLTRGLEYKKNSIQTGRIFINTDMVMALGGKEEKQCQAITYPRPN